MNEPRSTAAHAYWVTGPMRAEIRAESLPGVGPDDVLVRSLYSGISRGTELLVFRGQVPASEHERMRAPFQAGHFPAPVKYGYACVGLVEQGPQSLLGRTVFCLHPHQTRFVVPANAVSLVPPPVPAARAILAANLETAINGLWDAQLGSGDRVAVIGAGAVGCLVAWLAARTPGCDVVLIDTNPARAAVASELDVEFLSPGDSLDDQAGRFDLVVHASGHPAGLSTALPLAGFEATILEMSWFGEQVATLALGGAFHSQRLSLRASQVGAIPSHRRARWTYARRLALALRLLQATELDVLITGQDKFDNLPAAMHRLASSDANTICHRVIYSDPT